MAVDALAERLSAGFRKKLFRSYAIGRGVHAGQALYLVKPLTYMNSSGRAVREALRETGTGPGDLIVVCDSLDLSPGRCRFRPSGSSAGQKGIESIIQALGTDGFMRLFIGIGRPARKGQVVAYVLGEPGSEEADLIRRGVAMAADALLMLITDGQTKVMNAINRKEPTL
jgi:PTH1 family peptidyl-tRNA hydrolase